MRALCGARLRGKTDLTCQQSPVKGRKRCKFHGGASPRGAASPQYRGRGYSRDLPTALGDRVEVLRRADEIVSLTADLEVVMARVGDRLDQLTKVPDQDAAARLPAVIALLTTSIEEPETGDQEERLRECRSRLDDLLSDLGASRRCWDDIYEAMEVKRKLVETQLKREQLDGATMTAAQALTFVSEVQAALMEEVADQDTRTRVALRVQRALGGGIRARELPGER